VYDKETSTEAEYSYPNIEAEEEEKMILTFRVDGNPIAKSNSYRIHNNCLYKTANCKKWEAKVELAARMAIEARGLSGSLPLIEKGYYVGMNIKWFRRGSRRQDLDNIIKSIQDSLNKTVYYDDSQIIELSAQRFDNCPKDYVQIKVWSWK